MMIRLLAMLLLCGGALVPCQAPADPRAKPEALPLAKGQRFVFLGDSITHQGYWVEPLELMLMVSRPELDLEFFNAGVGGDSVAQGLWRLDSEVIARKPDIVTVLFGMNDGRYVDHDARLLATFENDLDALVARIAKETKARIVVLGPTYFDDLPREGKLKRPFYNDVLRKFEGAARRIAEAHKSCFVALNEPMRIGTTELRKADPKATLVPDGVHPEVAGGYAIASAIAAELWKDPPPVEITLTPTADGGNEHVVRIPRIAFPIPPEAKKVAQLSGLESRFNRFVLKGVGIGAGNRTLQVDGKPLGTWTASQLVEGVAVGELAEAPWRRRGEELWALAEQRRKLIRNEIRDKVAAIKREIKDERQRQESYAKIHHQLATSWARVAELEKRMHALCAPFEVKITVQ